MYTDLPKVNHIAAILKNEANLVQDIKIKLLRSGAFDLDGLMQFPIPPTLKINSIDIGVDRIVSLSPLVATTDQAIRSWIVQSLLAFIQQRASYLNTVLSQPEMQFVLTHLPLFFAIESLPGGFYIVRI